MLIKMQFTVRVLIFLMVISVGVIGAQKITNDKNAVQDVPIDLRSALLSRIAAYIRAGNSGDLDGLLSLLHPRAKDGLDLEKARKKAEGWRSEEQIIEYKIREVVKARDDDYTDEPKPKPEEGWKWSVRGCAKTRVRDEKSKKYDYGLDVWLVDSQWYVRRSGFRLADEGAGYEDCKF